MILTQSSIKITNKKLYNASVFDLCGEIKSSQGVVEIDMLLMVNTKGKIIEIKEKGKYKKTHFQKDYGFIFK